MKTLPLFLFMIFLAISGNAQITLEHTYSSGGAQRFSHETYGPIYYYASSLANQRTFHFFDSTHQPIQTTSIDVPPAMSLYAGVWFRQHFSTTIPGSKCWSIGGRGW